MVAQGLPRQPAGNTMVSGSLKLCSPFGIPVRLHYSWWLIVIPMLFTLVHWFYPHFYPQLSQGELWTMAALTTVLVFLSLLAHELGHAVAAQRFGIAVHSVELFVFGGVSRMMGFTRRPRDEFILAGSGPLVSLVFGLLAAGAYLLLRYPLGVTSPLIDVGLAVAGANAAMLIFNLIPAYPLDGGRLLQGVLWHMTRRRTLAAAIPAGLGWLLAAVSTFWGAREITRSLGPEAAESGWQFIAGLWWILIGTFIALAAYKSFKGVRVLERISGLSAAQALDARIQPVAPQESLLSARRAAFPEPDIPAAPILDDQTRAVSVLLNNNSAEPPDDGALAGQAAEPIPARLRLLQTTDLFETLMTMARTQSEWLLVEEASGRYVGLVTQASLRAAFRGDSSKKS